MAPEETTDRTPLNFVLTTFEGGGTVGPALTVAHKLIEQGHSVRVMSDRCNRPESEAVGARFVPWQRAPSRVDRSRESTLVRDWDAATPQAALLENFRKLMIGPAGDYAEDLTEELRREPADLVVSNELLFGVLLGCEAVGQRFAVLAPNVSLFPLPGVPPMGPGLPPAQSADDRIAHEQVARFMTALYASQLRAFNQARAGLALPPLTNLLAQLDAASAILLATARAFDFAPDTLPPNVMYVGPQLDGPIWARREGATADVADRTQLILVAFSTTYQAQTGALQRVIDALCGLPVHAIVTLGDTIAAEELNAPANVCLLRSGAHDEIMQRSALVVTHGGHGTVLRALLHGLPLLIMPHGRDQADNAVRVSHRGAGLTLPADANVTAIRSSIAALLGETRFGEAAKALGQRISAENDPLLVVRELVRLAEAARF